MVVLAALALTATLAAAQTRPVGAGAWQALHDRETLLGGWRTTLRGRGVDLSAIYTGDVMGVATGGVHRRTEYLGNVDLLLTVDAERLGAWSGLAFFLYGVGDHGRSPSANVGDVQAVDNIDLPNAFWLAEAWVQQRVLDERLSLLAGLYDLNSEFDVLETATLFVHSSFGMGYELAQTGRNGPSASPATGLGLRVDSRPADDLYARLAVLDGVPGDPDHPGGVEVRLDDDEGALLALEAGWRRGIAEGDERSYAKVGVGAWLYTGDFPRLRPGARDSEGRGNGGVYALAEWTVWPEADDASQGLALFGRVGWADPRYNRVDWFVSGGATWTGLVPGRDEDALGLGVARTFDGDDVRRAQRAAGERTTRGETAIELTYGIQLLPWLLVQPDVQVVVDPGDAPDAGDALVLGARVGIGF